ncbi:Protein translocase subunit SecA [Dirofilaria immitis]
MSENKESIPCASGCHSATDAHVFMNAIDAKPSESNYELSTMPTMQECDGACGNIYPADQLTKFPCLHVLCGMCLNECSLVERNGKFLCPMRECKYLSSTSLHLLQSSGNYLSNNSNERRNAPAEIFFDSDSFSAAPMIRPYTSKLSESESDEEKMNND